MKKIIRITLIVAVNGIELIASENYQSKEVLQVQSSVFANKYAEGFP